MIGLIVEHREIPQNSVELKLKSTKVAMKKKGVKM